MTIVTPSKQDVCPGTGCCLLQNRACFPSSEKRKRSWARRRRRAPSFSEPHSHRSLGGDSGTRPWGFWARAACALGGLGPQVPLLSEGKPLLHPSGHRERKNKAESQLGASLLGRWQLPGTWLFLSSGWARQPLCHSAPSQQLVGRVGGARCGFSLRHGKGLR